MARVKISLNDSVRIAAFDDWFHEGVVIGVTEEYIDVDFADWIQRYPIGCIREGVDCAQERFLGPGLEPGVTIKDYRKKQGVV